jgi:hypothetical protein
VLTLTDGSCPSCGARGELAHHLWQGKQILALVPASGAEPDSAKRYACLYLRCFAKRFRASARMRAIARATQSSGTMVALHGPEARLGLSRMQDSGHFEGFFVPFYEWMWNTSVTFIQFVLRGTLLAHGVELVDVNADRWSQTFRRLASHSSVIIMDASVATAGLYYEADFIADLALADRLILLHNGRPAARVAAEQYVERLHPAGIAVPIVPYSIWRLRRLTADLDTLFASRQNGGATRRASGPLLKPQKR